MGICNGELCSPCLFLTIVYWRGPVIEDDRDVAYQLHGFGDASNQAFSCVVYL